jgi:hypothetical protein
MKNIYLLTDYKNYFSSKYLSVPYRSGMNKDLLSKYFLELGYDVHFLNYSEIDFRTEVYKDKIFLYSSSEDIDGYYKDYIEDILLGLTICGAKIVPEFKYFRAHNNKVFMEILRDISNLNDIKNIKSKYLGTFEDAVNVINNKNDPFVIKTSAGSTSFGVYKSNNAKEFKKIIKKVSSAKNLYYDLWDKIRAIKRKGYVRESQHRKKFIVQNLIDGLQNDWKVLIFGNKYYVLFRRVRDNDFRASGSGKFEYKKELPDGFLDYCEEIYNYFQVPNISLDIAYNGNEFFLFEFQMMYFGTYTLEKSPFYYIKENGNWQVKYESSTLEKEYANSVINYFYIKNISF